LRTSSRIPLTLYQLALLSALFALLLPWQWIPAGMMDTGLILLNGTSNAMGQFWWTRALHLAPASAVAPFYYLSLVWASILGFVLWHEVPTAHVVLGSIIVVASGIFLLMRESSRSKRS